MSIHISEEQAKEIALKYAQEHVKYEIEIGGICWDQTPSNLRPSWMVLMNLVSLPDDWDGSPDYFTVIVDASTGEAHIPTTL